MYPFIVRQFGVAGSLYSAGQAAGIIRLYPDNIAVRRTKLWATRLGRVISITSLHILQYRPTSANLNCSHIHTLVYAVYVNNQFISKANMLDVRTGEDT